VNDLSAPRIAFCTTVKNRTEHLKKTLPANLADNARYPNAVFVVLDYDDDSGLDGWIGAEMSHALRAGRLVVYRYRSGGAKFHLSHAKNMAARCGMLEGAEILVTLDADNFTGEGFAHALAAAFREPGLVPGIFLCPNYALIKSLPHGAGRPPRGYAGRLAVWAQTFVKMGGYDERFDTWRGEDIDMNFRLQRAGYAMRYIDNRHLGAINHSAAVRFREYPHAQQYENKHEIEVLRARTETVVNAGRFGVGEVRRHCGTAVKLTPLPTRVFGIGLHRTATTSLHEAFKRLGFDSFHWGSGEAPLIWYEMKGLHRSRTLEQWYALCDLPIPLLYRELDTAYPNSKFILTIRNESDWLRSVARLWDPNQNPERRLWDIYPFTNMIHTEIYGRATFDAQVFAARYRRHNADVLEYFKDRPDDLLVMDMDAGVGWGDLCGFLGRPVPGEAYPKVDFMNRASVVAT
jgi:hypothetical protein